MPEQVSEVEALAKSAFDQVKTPEDLQSFRIEFLGKKGMITYLLKGLGQLPPEARREAGIRINLLRQEVEDLITLKESSLGREAEARRLEAEVIDVTLPGKGTPLGSRHPVNLVILEIKKIFVSLGFEVWEGPEIETDYYNFEALNIGRDHPARDTQDSFYITPDILLRTHTSPVQIRCMEIKAPEVPLRMVAVGKTYRRDNDATHSPMFHQVEGLVVDRGTSLAELKGTLLAFARRMFGSETRIRLRPSHFPFTEPSAEVDVSCPICGGGGCGVCKQSGWLEILGAGMVHPNVLRAGGYDPEAVNGFAFGMGVERIAMQRYAIDNMRLLFENDLRFLGQFR
ncbi:MAG: phenylalanine--tRNA ligase subunit alpha [Firmicutes bacterium]|nr:phenylalanine--tRNA ligase subunit alpha [Bacillota bacterium]